MEKPLFQNSEVKDPTTKYLFIGVVLAFILLPLICIVYAASTLFPDEPFPSDAEMISRFQNNEADFEKLNQMAKEDTDFTRIARDFSWTKDSAAYPRPKPQKDLSEKRWDEYRDLFQKLDLKMGILNSQPKDVWFLAATKGMVTGGSEKGYMYLMEEPSPIVESLDKPQFDLPELKERRAKILYRKIKDNWYLYYLVD